MVKRGDIVIAGDGDIGDLYICEVLVPNGNFRDNLRCRVLEPVRYPIQHAVMHPEVASENPPLQPDSVAMLRFTAFVQGYEPDGDRMLPMAEYYHEIGSGGYAAALRKAREEYEKTLRHKLEFQQKNPTQRWLRADPAELTILARHARGIYEGRRSCLWSA